MLASGVRLGRFEVLESLGTGGMGEVYRARDSRLGRQVALKVLSDRVQVDSHRLARFEREARALASLNHPNIAMLHGIEDVGDVRVLVLELVEGETLAERIARGPLALPEALVIAEQVAAALEAAHQRGVVHRDLKPSNVQLRPDGTVKLLDFGLAKVFAPQASEAAGAEVTATAIEPGGEALLIGTPAYMSPEQARGMPVDQRTDVWAFGCLLYEMLTARRPFDGERASDVFAKIIERDPDLDALPTTTPAALRRLIARCLVKNAQGRLRDIGDARLEIAEHLDGATPGRSSGLRRPTTPAVGDGPGRRWLGYVVTAALASSLAVALYWSLARDTDRQWLTEEALPRIEAHLDVADWESAYQLARDIEARVPGSPELGELWTRISWRVTISSDPPGATVYRQAYGATDGQWQELGRTPLEDIRFPFGLSRLRFELAGHRPLLRAMGGEHLNWAELTGADMLLDNLLVGPEVFRLDTEDSLPAGKVRVTGWEFVSGDETLALRDFFLDRYEVTNAQFKEFVDAGGYQRAELWDPIVLEGAVVPFERARTLLTDRTGRPGPSTWEAGDYAAGKDAFPVSGVSWYEAAAYARFRGEELPTAPHWQQALAASMFPWLLPLSNFGGEGPRAVTDSRAMTHMGAFDMTGNVREWTTTAIGDERIILGGSWNDPYYIAGTRDTSAPPLDRSPGNGIRLAVTADDPEVATRVRVPMTSRSTVAPSIEREPVSDEVYAAYGRFFDYERKPLKPSVESVQTSRVWTRERISFDAGYGTERTRLHLYLPTTGSPPYQTVVYWPGWDTFRLDDADQYFARQVDFLVKSGRAVAFPIYKGTFDRRVRDAPMFPHFNTAAYRDNVIDTVKELRRSIDYLETRSDIDTATFTLFGYSWGGVNGPAALAHEPRLRLGVIYVGLLPPMDSVPEADPLNALPRVRVPVLMFSGEFDSMVPLSNARRYFELLGTTPTEKRHVVAVGGHYVPRALLIRETLDWLDEHLGPTE